MYDASMDCKQEYLSIDGRLGIYVIGDRENNCIIVRNLGRSVLELEVC